MTVTHVCCPVASVRCIGQGGQMWSKEAGSEATVDAHSILVTSHLALPYSKAK